MSRLAIGVATILLSATIGYATHSFNRQAAQRQVQHQQESLTLQRRTVAAQILANELPAIVHGPEQERAVLLGTLELLDPALVQRIGERLGRRADSPASKREAARIIASSIETARRLDLEQHLGNAGKYRDFGLLAAAAREYIEASENLPEGARAELRPRLAAAREAYDRGNFSASVRMFEAIFERFEEE